MPDPHPDDLPEEPPVLAVVGDGPGLLLNALHGTRVIASQHLRDGLVMIAEGGTMLIGTRPLTPVEAAGREGRLIVRYAMADVLTWLGQPVYTEPTSAEIFDSLRRLAGLRH